MMPDNEQAPSSPMTASSTPRQSTSPLPLVLALIALAAAGWSAYDSRQQAAQIHLEQAQGQAELAALKEQSASLQTRLGAVEAAQEAFRSDADALSSLRQEIARGREETVLLEVEQAITLAAQQLQIAGNVQLASLALQTADARLARLERPQYLPLRKALAKDLERLNGQPFADVPGISLRLEQLVQAADRLPLAAYGRPASPPAKAPAEASPASLWQRTLDKIWGELKGLIRIQRFDQTEAVLLAPGQDFFLRENLKLRLLNARLALLARDQATFRSELKQAQDWLAKYFVADDKAVQAAQQALQQSAPAHLVFELPTLNDSQAALRSLRGSKEKR